METFEAACIVLYNAEPSDKRQEAESYLHEFQQQKSYFQDVYYVLLHTGHATVQFHCIKLLQDGILHRWSQLSILERKNWLQLLIQFLEANNIKSGTFICNAVIQAIVLLQKRAWLQCSVDERTEQIREIGIPLISDSLLLGTHVDSVLSIKRLLSLKWIYAFISEVASPSRAHAMNQPVIMHVKVRKEFEEMGHLRQFALDVLTFYKNLAGKVNENLRLSQVDMETFETSFTILLEILNWVPNISDESKRHGQQMNWCLSDAEDSLDKSILVPAEWCREIFIDVYFVQISYHVYYFLRQEAIRQNRSALASLSRQVMIQLASLQGPVFQNEEERWKYIDQVVSNTRLLLQNPLISMISQQNDVAMDIASGELLDMCHIFYRVTNNLGTKSLESALGSALDGLLMKDVASLCSKLLMVAAEKIQRHKELGTSIEDTWPFQGINILLDTWAVIVNNPCANASTKHRTKSDRLLVFEEDLRKSIGSIMKLYLPILAEKCALDCLAEEDTEKDVEDACEISFEDELEVAAILARVDAVSIAQLLLDSLNEIATQFYQELSLSKESASNLSQLMEKIHFYTQFSGLFLSDDYKSECPSIPNRIELCIRDQNGSTNSCSIQQLLFFITRQLLELESSRVAQDPSSHFTSPYISERLLETTTRLYATYMSPDLEDTAQATLVSSQVFSKKEEVEFTRFLLYRITLYIVNWPTQPLVMKHGIELLHILSRNKALSCALEEPLWLSLLEANIKALSYLNNCKSQHENAMLSAISRIPSPLRGRLIEIFCRAMLSICNINVQDGQLSGVLYYLDQRLHLVAECVRKKDRSQKEVVVLIQDEVVLLLHMYSGISRASGRHRMTSKHCLRGSSVFLSLLEIFQADAQVFRLTLAFYCDFIEVNLAFLQIEDALLLYQNCRGLIRHYVNGHQIKADASSFSEEKQEELAALIQLLSQIVLKDCVDLADGDDRTQYASDAINQLATDGLLHILPILDEGLFQYPELLLQFLVFIGHCVDFYPERIANMDFNSFRLLLMSVLHGVRHARVDINKLCLQILTELAAYHYRCILLQTSDGLGRQLGQNPQMFIRLTEVILGLSVTNSIQSTVLTACGSVLYYLVIIEQSHFVQLAHDICKAVNDERVQQELVHLSDRLVKDIDVELGKSVVGLRKNRATFGNNFERFIVKARGYLQMK